EVVRRLALAPLAEGEAAARTAEAAAEVDQSPRADRAGRVQRRRRPLQGLLVVDRRARGSHGWLLPRRKGVVGRPCIRVYSLPNSPGWVNVSRFSVAARCNLRVVESRLNYGLLSVGSTGFLK